MIDVKHDEQAKKTKYKITSTVVLEITLHSEQVGEVVLAGHLIKSVFFGIPLLISQKEEAHNLESNPVEWLSIIGKLVEETEGTLRSQLEAVYFGKTKEVRLVF